jgi:diadenosine tetraphosphate (Ap4A) HIT family hydrolase
VKPNLVQERIEAARRGKNHHVVGRLVSGWLVIGDRQPTPGYCLILADPVVKSLNALGAEHRANYLNDMARVGDVLLEATGAKRINYETLGNGCPVLHTHITPRYDAEPPLKRGMSPAFLRVIARRTTSEQLGRLKELLSAALAH